MILVPLTALLAACTASSPSTLRPEGPASALVVTLWWVLFGIAVVVCVVIIGLLSWALVRRRRAVPGAGTHDRFVFVLGVGIPAAILAGVFGFGLRDMAVLNPDHPRTQLTVEVIGHEWWWEVRYPAGGAITANEIHVPVSTNVKLRLRTADVIHSFWVPQVMPKTDLLPKRVNQVSMTVTKIGTYRGQCAEFCGLQHGHMAFSIVAQPPADFRAWLHDQARPAREPRADLPRLGRHVVTTSTCATCHTVRGTRASGDVGPDLTHVGSRSKLGAETIPNDFGHMAGWVSNSQSIKPGNTMPPQPLTPRQLRAVVAYLQGLK